MFPWMFNSEIESIAWESNYTEFEGHEGVKGYNTIGAMRLEDGMTGSLHYSSTVRKPADGSRLEVYGDNLKVLHAVDNDKLVLLGGDSGRQEWELDVSGPRVWGHQQIDEHFAKCILGEEEPRATVNEAVKSIGTAKGIIGG